MPRNTQNNTFFLKNVLCYVDNVTKNGMFQLCFYEIRLNFSTVTLTFSLFLLYIITIPLLIGFSKPLLDHFDLGLIWTCILFSFMTERLFHTDLEDGTLELYLLSSCPLQLLFLGKLLGNWSLKMAGVLCSVPLLSVVYNSVQSNVLYISIILGSLVFTLICGIYSCFTLSIKSNSWNSLQHLTTLPTLLPLIMLCTTMQTEINFLYVAILLGYLTLFLWVFWVFVSITLYNLLSR